MLCNRKQRSFALPATLDGGSYVVTIIEMDGGETGDKRRLSADADSVARLIERPEHWPRMTPGAPDLPSGAYSRWQFAQAQTAWGRSHLSRFALTEHGVLLATATRYLLSARLDGEPVAICALGDLMSASPTNTGPIRTLIEDVIAETTARCDADMAMLFCEGVQPWHRDAGFHDLTPTDVGLDVLPTKRPGAPMLSIRAGEDSDLGAIVAMGELRSSPFRFHLTRDLDFVKHGIVRERLRAGLGAAGALEVQFFVTEEGTIATAYVVLRVRGDSWTLLQCGDRDPVGARVGAILQALLARDPAGPRPTVRGWLPSGFTPPQVKRVSEGRSAPAVMVRMLGRRRRELPPTAESSLYWMSDHMC
jgi:hypothetical protein